MMIAMRIAAIAGHDGQNYPDTFMAALEAAPTITYENEQDVSDGAIRYEFSDGSAIVEFGAGWDLGVHRSRLSEAASRYSPDWNDDAPGSDVQFACVGAGCGVNEADAFEARQT